jgi:2-polyprenyl-6-methoxyphenol hydroxylase-like FAD-dependent oxidoreductase
MSDAAGGSGMRVLIVGAGIAGLTLAWWLRRRSHEVVLVERAPRLRDEGYMIDFFGSGYDVAERMQLLTELGRIHYPVERLVFVAPDGSERVSLPYPVLRDRLFENRHFNFMRGDLERVLREQLDSGVVFHFGTTISSLVQERERVRVTLSANGDDSAGTFDLVVGADGLHSQVRELAFGPEPEMVRYLGFHTAAFVLDDPELASSIGNSFRTLSVPGRQVAIYPIRGGRVATFFVHPDANQRLDSSLAGARRELREVYGGMPWVVPRILDHLDRADHAYLDVVSQVVAPRWHLGRVVLVGDACGCVSLLAGQGASLAMGGAYVLAEELERDPILESALSSYQERVQPLVAKKQKAARKIARWFVPGSRIGIAARDFAMRMSAWPVASWFVKRQLSAESVLGAS